MAYRTTNRTKIIEMKITYELTEREKEFLLALSSKHYPEFAYSGRMTDDKFRQSWKEEISTFENNGLFKNVDNGEGAYWEYRLNKKGMELYEELIKSATELKS